MTVYGSYAIAMWAYSHWVPNMLSHAKGWAGNVRFDWEQVCRDRRGFKFCPLGVIGTVIPESAKIACSAAASGAAWLPHTSGSYFGVIAAACNRPDLERASALAGAVAHVCFYGYNEQMLASPPPGIATIAAYAREAYQEERALQFSSRV